MQGAKRHIEFSETFTVECYKPYNVLKHMNMRKIFISSTDTYTHGYINTYIQLLVKVTAFVGSVSNDNAADNCCNNFWSTPNPPATSLKSVITRESCAHTQSYTFTEAVHNLPSSPNQVAEEQGLVAQAY